MRTLRHIAIMGLLSPWIGGTLIGYCAYWNTRVTDIASALFYLVTAAIGVLLAGLLLFIVPNCLVTAGSYVAFMLVSRTSVSRTVKKSAIVLLSLSAAAGYAWMMRGTAAEIDASTTQVALSAMLTGSLAAWLNCLNWGSLYAVGQDIQPSRAANRR
jgi:hypothetical protein